LKSGTPERVKKSTYPEGRRCVFLTNGNKSEIPARRKFYHTVIDDFGMLTHC
jgi:hypothetical protein